jgi:hypothetical protein
MMIIKAITTNTKIEGLFTVYFFDGTYLSIDNGNCDRFEGCSFGDGELDYAANSGELMVNREEKLVNFWELPEEIQKIVKKYAS